jgi:galactokinase
MVYSLKLSFVANGNHPTDVGLSSSKTICFSSLEFTIDHFKCISLSLEGTTRVPYS